MSSVNYSASIDSYFSDEEKKRQNLSPSQVAAQDNKAKQKNQTVIKSASASDAQKSIDDYFAKEEKRSKLYPNPAPLIVPEPTPAPVAKPSVGDRLKGAVGSVVQKVGDKLSGKKKEEPIDPNAPKTIPLPGVDSQQQQPLEQIKGATSNLFDTLANMRKQVNASVGDALTYPLGKPVGRYNETDQGFVGTGAFQKDETGYSPYDVSLLKAENEKLGVAAAELLSGRTFGIVKPNVVVPDTPTDHIIAGISNLAGNIAGMKQIGGYVEKFLGTAGAVAANGQQVVNPSGVLGKEGIAKIIQTVSTKFPKVAQFIEPAIKGSATFNIMAQLDPDNQDRLKSVLTSTIAGIALPVAGARSYKVALPSVFALGAGLTKLDGGSTEDALQNGLLYVAFEMWGKLGKSKSLVTGKEVDPILKQKALETLNGYLEKPLPKNASIDEINAAWKQAIRTHHPDKGGTEATATSINTAHDILTGKNSTQIPRPAEADQRVVTPEDLKTQVMGTDLQNTPAAKTVADIAAKAEAQGKHVIIDPSGETGTIIETPQGNKVGLSITEERVSQMVEVDASGTPVPMTETASQESSTPVEQATAELGGTKSEIVVSPEEKPAVTYTPDKTITPEMSVIEKNFGEYLNKNLDLAEKEYTAKFGNVINTDNARELSVDYNANRNALSQAVQQPASSFVTQLYEKRLQEALQPGQMNTVVFTAGGTGAGKTTAINTTPEYKNTADSAQIVYDTNLTNFDKSKRLIDLALDAGKTVKIIYVVRDPVEAMVNGAVPRAIRMGRTVPIQIHADTHTKSLETIQKLAEHYKENTAFGITVLDNNKGKGGAVKITLEELKKISYNSDEIKKNVEQKLKELHDSGKITKEIYEGFTRGHKEISGVEQKARRTSSGESQQPDQKELTKSPLKTKDIPHKDGFSRLQERIEAQILQENGDKYDFDPESGKYNKMSLKKDAEEALKLLKNDPEKALRIARGLEAAPENITENNIRTAVALKAKEEGNIDLWKNLITKGSLRLTRFGQEIVTARGNFNDNSPENWMKKVIDIRMNKLGSSIVTEAEKSLGKKLSAKTKAIEKIDKEVQKLSKKITKDQIKIKRAQDIIDSLKCT